LNNARLYTEGIVNTIRDPLLILDNSMRVKRATSGFYNRFKTNEKDTEGQYLYELTNGQWDIPELRKLLQDILPAKRELQDFEVTQVFPGMGKRNMLLNARRLDNINGEQLILLAIEDVTDKRKVEEGLAEAERLLGESRERLKFAVDSAGLGTWDYDPRRDELACDRRCKEVFGVSPLAMVDLQCFYGMIHADDRQALEDKVNQTLSDNKNGEFEAEYRTVPIDGRSQWLKIKGRAYYDIDGHAIRFIGTLLDVTIQRLMDVAVNELLRKKDEFISVASHELKTPITSLKLLLQTMERTTAGNAEMKAFVVSIKKSIRQVDKLSELIGDLLDVTKIQSGKMDLQKTTFLLDELVKECCEEQQAQSVRHQLVIEGDKDVNVFADRNRMEQVLDNLISNAIKYSPDSETVIVRVEKVDEGVKISVVDFGIGISANKVPLIFDRFYRVDESSRRYAGLGLGLYISSEIIRRHNGSIDIKSEEGKGSTFWFVIPN